MQFEKIDFEVLISKILSDFIMQKREESREGWVSRVNFILYTPHGVQKKSLPVGI